MAIPRTWIGTLALSCGLLFMTAGTARADFFIDKCGGKKVKALTLNGACKKNLGKTIVKCKNKCTKRKGLKCKERTWKLKKSKTCGLNTGSKRNRFKTRKCNEREIATLVADYADAKRRATRVKRGVDAERKKKHSKSTKRRLDRVARKMNKILKMLNKKVTITCKDEKGMCKKANAHTVMWLGRGMRACSGYFECGNQDYRAAVIVHELAHKAGANDKRYFSGCSTGPSASPPTNIDWSKIADSYEYWARFGFCIPGKTCA